MRTGMLTVDYRIVHIQNKIVCQKIDIYKRTYYKYRVTPLVKEVTAVLTARNPHVPSTDWRLTIDAGLVNDTVDKLKTAPEIGVPEFDSITSLHDFDASGIYTRVPVGGIQPIDDRRIAGALREFPADMVMEHALRFGLSFDDAVADATELVHYLVLRHENPQVDFAADGRVAELLFTFRVRAMDYATWCYQLTGSFDSLSDFEFGPPEIHAYRAFYAAYTARFGTPPEIWPQPEISSPEVVDTPEIVAQPDFSRQVYFAGAGGCCI